MPANHVIVTLITDIRSKLEKALSIVMTAETCALSGSTNRSVQVMMDFEGLINESQDLFRAALTIKRRLLVDTDGSISWRNHNDGADAVSFLNRLAPD